LLRRTAAGLAALEFSHGHDIGDVNRTFQPEEVALGILLALSEIMEDRLDQTSLLLPFAGPFIGSLEDYSALLAEQLRDLSPASLGGTRDDDDFVSTADMKILFGFGTHEFPRIR